MPAAALAYGLLLILVGVVGYVGSGGASVTALIPAFLGVPVVICGELARRRVKVSVVMHIAALLALVALVGTARSFGGVLAYLGGGDVARPGALVSQLLTAILSLAFLVLAVRSFLLARASRGKPG